MPPLQAADGGVPLAVQPQAEAEQMAARLRFFLSQHPGAAILEGGKSVFELAQTQYRVDAVDGQCTLQLWSADRNLTRRVLSVVERANSLRLSTRRFGYAQPGLLTLVASQPRREPKVREPARQAYLRLLERVLQREFPDWQTEGFRVSMDLERSFGPAYARGSLVRGSEAWAVIGVSAAESQALVDGVLTPGILWLHHCRERSEGRRLYKGLRLVVPQGGTGLTLARLPWLNNAAAQWELWQLSEGTEELALMDPADRGNLRTRLVHHPDPTAALERFASAIDAVLGLVPKADHARVEQRLRSPTELAFLLHGLEFARARISLAPSSFAHTLEILVGTGAQMTLLTGATAPDLSQRVAELCRRRSPQPGRAPSFLRSPDDRGIGAATGRAAHHRLASTSAGQRGLDRLEQRERALAAQQDPLYRAAPERWLESVLRENLAPLTRSLAPHPQAARPDLRSFANEQDPDTRGNRAEASPHHPEGNLLRRPLARTQGESLIPHFNAGFVYTQVPAIAGATDRGMLDLLGITDDGRLAVIELKASDDLHLPLQGLDYWIRVRHHHQASHLPAVGGANAWQQHGYFPGVELSPEPPRLFLIAPALHIHPSTETVLRYLSPQVEWTLLALDERWRQQIRVVWRKTGGRRDPAHP